MPPSEPSLVESGDAPKAPRTKIIKMGKVVLDVDPETRGSDALEVAVTQEFISRLHARREDCCFEIRLAHFCNVFNPDRGGRSFGHGVL